MHDLRSFLGFSIFMVVMFVIDSDIAGLLFFVSAFWGASLAFEYVKLWGWPGTKGWFGQDWEDWINEREGYTDDGREIPITDESGFRDKDLV